MKKSKKAILWTLIGTLIGASIVLISFGLAKFITDDLANKKKPSINVNVNKKDNYDIDSEIIKKPIFDNNHKNTEEYLSESLIFNDSNGEIKTTKFKYDKQIQPNKVIEYIDPYTKIKFVDFAYYEDKNGPRFLLGEEGLKYLAREFKNKVPFGPEVFNLNAIHINDFNIVDDKVRGLFISNVNTIYINANFLSENGYDIETKVQNIIPTIFHEYLHYWAKTYAEVGIDSKNSELNKNTLLISSKSDEGYQTSAWNKNFVNNFKEQLGYNSTKKYPTVNNKQSLFSNLSLNDLWNIANGGPSSAYPNKNYFVSQISHKKSDGYLFDINTEEIKYYYSIDELIPRELTKYFFIPYYFPYEETVIKDSSTFENVIYRNNWYGLESLIYQNGSYYNDFTPNSLYVDYSKTILNPVVKYAGSNWFNTNDKILVVYQNYLQTNKEKAKQFYKLLLETMGYGKTISQVINVAKNNTNKINPYDDTVAIQPEETKKIRLVGYLPTDSQYKGFVFESTDSKNPYILAEFDTHEIFRFQGYSGSIFDNNNNDRYFNLSPTDVKLSEEFKSYITKEFVDTSKIKNSSVIHYWLDKNNDGKLQNDEIVDDVITLPENRDVAVEVYNLKKENSYIIIKNKTNLDDKDLSTNVKIFNY
ncbi:hypothetical protein MADP15_00042 [Mycoplasma anatis]|uniref:MYPU_1760 family metalloprotease n=1 Tax=Mycoplasmopsis anatis TaxID=171279 RepID=UPI001C4E0EA1|nr:hypothetical protein [Mycoplasmopsis anatis]MBW0595757.1 hypothetical protein [Mycoplasmopsis anatis]MBW0596593.1 hypothetical protein [Mycoplasmopsis anatis]MBW0600300.1 hypothetical protein [Mycoplasmopsis anatis]MBW0603797.1 hypothetical protein [Mycoplasmopsis anatis]